MKTYVYSAYDTKVGVYNNPTFQVLDPDNYMESLRRGVVSGKIEKNMAQDIEIIFLGIYDDKTGLFELVEHQNLGSLRQWISPSAE